MSVSNERRSRRRRVTASELAEMSVCERRMLLRAEYGPRFSRETDVALRRGTAAHSKFYRDAKDTQVTGDSRCFIASAVFGESAETQTLRRFRDEVLLQSMIGRWIVKVYYSIGPAMALFLAASSRRRAIARSVLRPIVMRASMALVRRRRVG